MAGRVDLGNVRGKQGATGKGIIKLEYIESESGDGRDVLRAYYSDNTPNNPSYDDFEVVKPIIQTTDTVSNSQEYSDYIPTNRAVYNALTQKAGFDYVYSKQQTDGKIREAISSLEFAKFVSELPTGNDIKTDFLYLLTKQEDSTDKLNPTIDLFINHTGNDNDWEQIDSLSFNIDNYYTKSQANNAFAEKIHFHEFNSIFSTSNFNFIGAYEGASLDQTISEIDNRIYELQNNSTNIDSSMDSNSENAVENRVIKAYVDNRINSATGNITSGDSVGFTRTLSSGTKIGTITINNIPTDIYCNNDTNTTYSAVTQSSNGLMSSTDKTKLDQSKTIGYGKTSGSAAFLTVSIDGVGLNEGTIIAVYNNTANNSASASLNVNGLGSKPIYYKNSRIAANVFQKNTTCLFIYNTTIISSGCWQMLEFDTTYSTATSSSDGLMSSSDKSKLDGVSDNANNYTHPTYTTITGKPTTDQSPSFGGSFTVSQLKSDGSGHLTSATDRTITIPSTLASTSTNGLMSSTDKTKLNGIETNANKYTHPSYTARTGVPTGNQTPSFGATFNVGQVTSDGTGHITGITTRTVKIPNNTASASSNGLMSSSDKSKLDNLTWERIVDGTTINTYDGYIEYYENELFASLEIIDWSITVDTDLPKGYWRNIDTIPYITEPHTNIVTTNYKGSSGIEVAISTDKYLRYRCLTSALTTGIELNLTCSLIWRI